MASSFLTRVHDLDLSNHKTTAHRFISHADPRLRFPRLELISFSDLKPLRHAVDQVPIARFCGHLDHHHPDMV